MPASPSLPPVPMLVAAAACWGVGTVVTKQVLADVAALTLLPIQLLASCLFLLIVFWASDTRITWSPSLRRLTALGLLNPGLAYALGLLGLTSISASMSVLLWATEPILILLLAVAVIREQVAAALVATMAVAVVGVVLVVYRPGASGSAVGVALTLSAVTGCALYTVLARRLLLDDASVAVALVQQAAALAFAVLLVSVVQVGSGEGLDLTSLTPQMWLAAALSGVLYYGLAFWFYLAGLRQVSASVAGAFITLVPVFGVAAGHLVGERLDARQWLGAAIVVIAISLFATQQTAPDAVTAQPDRANAGRGTGHGPSASSPGVKKPPPAGPDRASGRSRRSSYSDRMTVAVTLLAESPTSIGPVAEMRWREWGHAPEPVDPAWWLETTRREAGTVDLPVTFVAVDAAGETVGAIGLDTYDLEDRHDTTPWVTGMIVRRDRRGDGVGRTLLRQLEQWAVDHGIDQVWVGTGQAEGFYRRCSWIHQERFTTAAGEDVVILHRRLPDAQCPD